ncbi:MULTISPECIES: MotA/TolQ/ExbB proton channel family protein [Alteromonadaceae]|uniref:MotA/TolQ/ExbB proton channel family protein n=1 Tax=Alteromonadaceae TaxID=72275 RepID=UPI001C084AE7|nr:MULTISPECIES: MotA/TolQ/ExbB proton channel family protein [Aliiglaciecola]MBU2879863.1 MotA/TolQ/ExbB proton channel family protein [Aliiglaciecola lipolytica]MDO6709858.1 MotA/TolQ/ExbB proton channel family protein [Aliiglaciecola sp. 2_MG-2023]MDO6751006.1 MotA/TolQ/ExbB proton channel family protein [Aliiglaciecola sp. 1_MG-2023]
MKLTFKSVFAATAVTLLASGAHAQSTLDQLLDEVKQNRVSEARLDKKREAEFQSARADKQALLRSAQAALKAEEARGDRLAKQFSDNEVTLTEKSTELDMATGDLGEMFGVVRQAASESYGRIATSIVSAQFPGRAAFLKRMSEESEGLPNIRELEDMWIALQTEMTESGKIARFNTEVINLEGGSSQQEVVRVGAFNLVGEVGYLVYDDQEEKVQPLGRQPDEFQAETARELYASTSGIIPTFVDPSSGAILGLLKQKATWEERYHAGGPVGYTITVMLVIGLLIGFYKIITLTLISGKMRSQLNNPGSPSSSNPLGRVLKVYNENKTADTENLEMKLDEAILKELPSIESGINIIKIFAAIAPLLGLLGTVLGMIATFQQITLFGTGDPRLMAGSISMALVTTAQGIIAALPLILMHSIVAGRSKSIVHILDEQTAGIVAAHAESEKA